MFKSRKDYYFNGVIIKISRRNVELVKQISGLILVIYVIAWIVVGVSSNGLMDTQTSSAIQSILELPTAIALVAYVNLEVKLELDKPKHRSLSKNKSSISISLIVLGTMFIVILIYVKFIQ